MKLKNWEFHQSKGTFRPQIIKLTWFSWIRFLKRRWKIRIQVRVYALMDIPRSRKVRMLINKLIKRRLSHGFIEDKMLVYTLTKKTHVS